MSSLVLINRDGSTERKLACSTTLPTGFELPEGHMLSWEEQPVATGIWEESTKYRAPEIIRHKKATACLRFLHPTVVIRIESPVADDLFELRDILILFIGGKVIGDVKMPIENTPSFIAGVAGDIKRLRIRISAILTSIKQRIGMKLASL